MRLRKQGTTERPPVIDPLIKYMLMMCKKISKAIETICK